METDFVNVFIQKQKDVMNDLLARVVMLEAKTSLAESKLHDVDQTNQQLQSELVRSREALNEQINKTKEVQAQLDLAQNLKNEITSLQEQVDLAADEKKALLKQLTDSNVQKGILQTRLNALESQPASQKKS